MFNVAKYIRTDDDNIIIFPCTLKHSDFKSFNPQSAGFIKISIEPTEGGIDVGCECYGESESLRLKSNHILDSKLAYAELIHTKEI